MENFDDETGVSFLAFQEAKAKEIEWLQQAESGDWLARLIAFDPAIVCSFTDHELVAHKLLAAGQVETLVNVASSGLLTGLSLRFYRMALCIALLG